ncbi:pentatricopeptide repeat-containing protein [Striga asiatica]|uniref:Pentatricopeptide repeat-containing protein n=1 Tax=Striga asiatica TaxID=4170 RepID=A0A5A7PZY3_STRAF|nr:pentatricopeptide repeat-containing protein [Striga asiatica]
MIRSCRPRALHVRNARSIVAIQTCIVPAIRERQHTLHGLHTTAAAGKLTLGFAKRDDPTNITSPTSTYDYNVRMAEIGRRASAHAARKLFDGIPERDRVSYASMISIYLKHDEFHKAEKLFYEIPEDMRTIVADSAMVDAYAKAGRMDQAKDVFDKMPERNSFSWSSLISGYFRAGKVHAALELFAKMPERDKNEITWTNVITGFSQNGLIDEARRAFDRTTVKNVVMWTSMVKAYIENDRVDEAFKLFREMPERNLYSWNIMVRGLLDEGRINEANELFKSMTRKNVISWTTMVTGLAKNGMTDLARIYFDRMPNKDISAWNAMITAYADTGRMVEARELFNSMSNRNIVTWNAMIHGYSMDQQADEAFSLFISMRRDSITPKETSLTSLLTSCSGILGVIQVHGLIVQLGYEIETSLANTLITMYYRCGDITSARIVFDNLEAKDVVSWTAIISAYSNHGLGMWALQAFARMIRSGHAPDGITFVGVLSGCSHAGFVRKGRMLFDSMRSAYGLEPTSEHYSCLVDILGRAGLVNEAMKVVNEMPLDKCDGVVLGALVSACRLHGDDELADHIGDELIELEPGRSGAYVLLGNLYASCGKWDKFSELRKKMKEREVNKVPGYSQIEVNGRIHVFLVGDKSHPEMKEIYLLLREKLLLEMRDFGYDDCSIV